MPDQKPYKVGNPVGLHVEVDESGCIVLVKPMLSFGPIRLTITNVDQLVSDLRMAQVYAAIEEGS